MLRDPQQGTGRAAGHDQRRQHVRRADALRARHRRRRARPLRADRPPRLRAHGARPTTSRARPSRSARGSSELQRRSWSTTGRRTAAGWRPLTTPPPSASASSRRHGPLGPLMAATTARWPSAIRAARPQTVFVAGDVSANGPKLIADLTAVLGREVHVHGRRLVQRRPPSWWRPPARAPRGCGSASRCSRRAAARRPGRRFAAEFERRFSQRPCCFSVHDAQATRDPARRDRASPAAAAPASRERRDDARGSAAGSSATSRSTATATPRSRPRGSTASRADASSSRPPSRPQRTCSTADRARLYRA